MQDERAEITIGTRLRRLLALRGQSIREFSASTGIAYRTLQDYLGDKGKPGSEQLARIARAGIDVNFVLTGVLCGRSRVFFKEETPPDDESYYVFLDEEVFNIIDQKARDAITSILAFYVKDYESHTFGSLVDTYSYIVSQLLETVAKAKEPLDDAKRRGASVNMLLYSLLGVDAHKAAVKFINQSARDSRLLQRPSELGEP